MNIAKELREKRAEEMVVAARLAVAYAHLAMAPYDSWGHEGGPAEMAAYVVAVSKERGNFGFLQDSILGEDWYRSAQ